MKLSNTYKKFYKNVFVTRLYSNAKQFYKQAQLVISNVIFHNVFFFSFFFSNIICYNHALNWFINALFLKSETTKIETKPNELEIPSIYVGGLVPYQCYEKCLRNSIFRNIQSNVHMWYKYAHFFFYYSQIINTYVDVLTFFFFYFTNKIIIFINSPEEPFLINVLF